jgi:hypothetical protein
MGQTWSVNNQVNDGKLSYKDLENKDCDVVVPNKDCDVVVPNKNIEGSIKDKESSTMVNKKAERLSGKISNIWIGKTTCYFELISDNKITKDIKDFNCFNLSDANAPYLSKMLFHALKNDLSITVYRSGEVHQSKIHNHFCIDFVSIDFQHKD